ncbi:MAG: hypothetical protein AAGK78_01340, partial [Planctomycetota bacterium]
PRYPWRATWWLTLGISLLYLVPLTPLWTPGGDSEFFVSAARSIVRGEGYRFNGGPVAIAPPAWPLLLAGVFQISPTFLAAKLVNILCLAGAWLLAHRVLLRLMPTRIATTAVLLSAILNVAYPLTFWLHSDPLFCLVAWTACLSAVRLAEDAGRRVDWAVLLLASALLPVVRYAALIQMGITMALLLGGWNRHRKRTIAAVLAVGVATAASFKATEVGLAWHASSLQVATQPDEWPATPTLAESQTASVLSNGPATERSWLADRTLRVAQASRWPAWLLVYPMRFASAIALAAWIPLVVGLVVMAAIATATRWRQWQLTVWPAVLIYILLLAFVWPLPNARYLVPVAPLVIGGVLLGLQRLEPRRFAKPLTLFFVGVVGTINAGMYVVDVVVQRIPNYYAHYEGGQVASLIAACDYMNEVGVGDREVAISERYDNLGAMRFLKTSSRQAVLLLDREVIIVPDVYSFPPGEVPEKTRQLARVNDGGFRPWAAGKGFRWYLYQQPVRPWRLWHFEVPAWLQNAVARDDDDAPARTNGWKLWSSDDGFEVPIELPDRRARITRVPGL